MKAPQILFTTYGVPGDETAAFDHAPAWHVLYELVGGSGLSHVAKLSLLDHRQSLTPTTSSSTAGAARRAAGRRSTPSSTRCAPSTDETCSSSPASPSPSFVRTPMRRNVLIAARTSCRPGPPKENFDKWEAIGLIMYDQMTGSWMRIGTQGILQNTYETLGSLAQAARLGATWRASSCSHPAWARWAARNRWRSP